MKQRLGFTLLEVLIALVVISVALSGSFAVLRQGAGSAARLEDRTLAQWVLSNSLNEARLSDQPPIGGNNRSSETMLGRRFIVTTSTSLADKTKEWVVVTKVASAEAPMEIIDSATTSWPSPQGAQ